MAVSSSGSIFTGKNRISIFDAVDLESQKHHPVACIFNPTSLTIVCGKFFISFCINESHERFIQPFKTTSRYGMPYRVN